MSIVPAAGNQYCSNVAEMFTTAVNVDANADANVDVNAHVELAQAHDNNIQRVSPIKIVACRCLM
jgi:hypothetical protein